MIFFLLATAIAGGQLIYIDDLPTTFNPIHATTLADHRVHQLLFDRIFYHTAIS